MIFIKSTSDLPTVGESVSFHLLNIFFILSEAKVNAGGKKIHCLSNTKVAKMETLPSTILMEVQVQLESVCAAV